MSEARKLQLQNLKELHEAMDAEDDELQELAHHQIVRKYNNDNDDDDDNNPPPMEPRKGLLNHDLLEDEEVDNDVDDDWDEHVKAVANASISNSQHHQYCCSVHHFIEFLFIEQTIVKKKKKTKQNDVHKYEILHDDLLHELLQCGTGNSSKAQAQHSKIIMEHLQKAGPDYHPIDLSNLEVIVFFEHLLKMTDTKEGDYYQSYGGHCSGLTWLFTACKVTPSKEYQQKLKGLMKALKNKLAEACGKKGKRLTEGKEPMPFMVYCQLCLWLIEEDTAESAFGCCFLTMTWTDHGTLCLL